MVQEKFIALKHMTRSAGGTGRHPVQFAANSMGSGSMIAAQRGLR